MEYICENNGEFSAGNKGEPACNYLLIDARDKYSNRTAGSRSDEWRESRRGECRLPEMDVINPSILLAAGSCAPFELLLSLHSSNNRAAKNTDSYLKGHSRRVAVIRNYRIHFE